MPTVSCSVRRAFPFYTERNFKKLLLGVLVKAGTRIKGLYRVCRVKWFQSSPRCYQRIKLRRKKLNNLLFSCLSHKITARIPAMSSMFPTFTRKFCWFTLTLPDSLITKFLLTKGGVGSFGFSHFLKPVFRFLHASVLRFWCPLRFAVFLF